MRTTASPENQIWEQPNAWKKEPLVDEALLRSHDEQTGELEDPLAIPFNSETNALESDSPLESDGGFLCTEVGFVKVEPLPVINAVEDQSGDPELPDDGSCKMEYADESRTEGGGSAPGADLDSLVPERYTSGRDVGEERHKCHECQKTFTRKYGLKKHMKLHFPKQEVIRRCKCEHCPKTFAHKDNLAVHMRKHRGQRPFECDQCEKRFTRKYDLTSHRVTHTGERPFECDQCQKRFSLKSYLTMHRVVHTGEKPYKCNVCQKVFAYKSTLNTHKLSHTNNMPFKCDLCPMRFGSRFHFTEHKLMHTGEKPFQCDLCKKRFLREVQLARHMQTHTGEKPYHISDLPFDCNLCPMRFLSRVNRDRHVLTHKATQDNGQSERSGREEATLSDAETSEEEKGDIRMQWKSESEDSRHDTYVPGTRLNSIFVEVPIKLEVGECGEGGHGSATFYQGVNFPKKEMSTQPLEIHEGPCTQNDFK